MGIKPVRKSKPSSAAPSLADALFSTTQQRVLRLLFSNPDRSFFASELIELAGSGSGAVQRELTRLVGSGLVSRHVVGRQTHFQVNLESPIYEELRSIVGKTLGIADVLREAMQPLAKHVALALLYGSFAKGESNSRSDVDLLVVGVDIALEELYSALESAETTLRRRVNPTLYSPQEFKRRRAARNPFLTKVLSGKTEIILGSLDGIEAAR